VGNNCIPQLAACYTILANKGEILICILTRKLIHCIRTTALFYDRDNLFIFPDQMHFARNECSELSDYSEREAKRVACSIERETTR